MKIIAITGYARSGKTSLLNYARKMGFEVFSTSQWLDKVTITFLQAFHPDTLSPKEWLEVLRNKQDSAVKAVTGLTARQLKIKVAEELVEPLYGRETAIVEPVVRDILNSGEEIVFFETLGGEEWTISERLFQQSLAPIEILKVNLVSEDQLKGVDIREPFAKPDLLALFEPEKWYNGDSDYTSQYRRWFLSQIIDDRSRY